MTGTLSSPSSTTRTGEDDSKARKRHVQNKTSDTSGENRLGTVSSSALSTSLKHQSQGARIRQSIDQEQKRERLEQRRITRTLKHSQQNSMQRMHKALVLNGILVFMGAVLYWKPQAFFRAVARGNTAEKSSFQWPPRHLAILYPMGVSSRNDLPPFLNQYAIATKENQHTRDAVRHLITIREKLKPFQIFVTAWERKKIPGKYKMDDYCGVGFEQTLDTAIEKGSSRYVEDLLHWCLLHTYQNDGFVHWNITMKRSPISLNHRYTESETLKGIVAKHVSFSRIHPSFLWLPKKRQLTQHNKTDKPTHEFDMNSRVPEKLLSWLLHTAPTLSAWEYAQAVEDHLYQLILAEEGEENWTILDAICDHYGDDDDSTTRQLLLQSFEKRTVMARDCLNGESSCCDVYLPEDR
jgi:hypothetical protein